MCICMCVCARACVFMLDRVCVTVYAAHRSYQVNDGRLYVCVCVFVRTHVCVCECVRECVRVCEYVCVTGYAAHKSQQVKEGDRIEAIDNELVWSLDLTAIRRYEVAMISSLLQIIGLFCKRAL